jgi:hypothetical protein
MKLMFDAFWRAAAYCVMPRVIGLSIAPLLIAVVLAGGLGWFFWEDSVTAVRASLENWALVEAMLRWIDAHIGAGFRTVLAPLVVVALAVPVVLVVSMLLVALLMTPAIVSLVAERRFPALERRRGAGALQAAAWSLGCSVVAVAMLLASVPLWLVPPLVLILPPLIWGWLTTQVLGFDVLADHASADERRRLLREHRLPLLLMGIVAGYLGAAPSLIWAFGAMTLVFAPLLIAVSIWLYTLVFAFAALWFAHYALAALDALRRVDAAAPAPGIIEVPASPPGPPAPLPDLRDLRDPGAA